MDFKPLRYALAVAHYGNVSKAAQALGISQPSLSKYLKNMSENAGIALFELKKGKLSPTYAGERYLIGARQMLSLVDELYNVTGDDPSIQNLCVASPSLEGTYIQPFAIMQFHTDFPESKLTITEDPSVLQVLMSGEADLAITSFIPDNPEITCELLTTDEIVLVVSKLHSIGNYAEWRDGCRYPWVEIGLLRNEHMIQLYPDQGTQIKASELLRQERFSPPVLLQTHSTLTAIRTASTGVGFCFVPEMATRNIIFPEEISCYSVGDPLNIDIFVAYPKAVPLSNASKRFIEIVRSFLN